MGEVESVSFERAAGESQLAPGSRLPSPSRLSPGIQIRRSLRRPGPKMRRGQI